MDCGEWRTKFNKYLDEALKEKSESIELRTDASSETAFPAYLLEHANACSDCMRRFRAAEIVLDGVMAQAPAPEYLARRIKTSLPISLRINRIHTQKWLALTAAAAFVVVCAGLIITLLNNAVSPEPADSVTVRFILEAPGANRVEVVGDWNGWDPSKDPLTDSDGDGTWETTLHLIRGKEYRYQFLINNADWIADPQAPLKIEDGFGGWNSILQL